MNTALDMSRSSGMVVVGIEELSELIGYSKSSITKWVTASPDKLPPRLKTGTASVRWLLADVWEWLESQRQNTVLASQAPAIPAAPAKPKKRRGRPPESLRIAALRAGMSTSDYIASQQVV